MALFRAEVKPISRGIGTMPSLLLRIGLVKNWKILTLIIRIELNMISVKNQMCCIRQLSYQRHWYSQILPFHDKSYGHRWKRMK